MNIPAYYLDIRDLLGNQFYQDALSVKLVPNGSSAVDTGITMVRSPNYGLFFCDIPDSNSYDLYIHRPDIGYILMRTNVFMAGQDIEDKVAEKKAFRVGAGYPVLFSNPFEQVVSFDIRNWDASVSAGCADGKFQVVSSRYEYGYSALVLNVWPTMYATPRERSQFYFVKSSTGEYKNSYVCVL